MLVYKVYAWTVSQYELNTTTSTVFFDIFMHFETNWIMLFVCEQLYWRIVKKDYPVTYILQILLDIEIPAYKSHRIYLLSLCRLLRGLR